MSKTVTSTAALLPTEITKLSFKEALAARMKGEALSIVYLGQPGLVAVTMKQSDVVLVIDYKLQSLVSAATVRIPRGVLHDTREGAEHDILVSSAQDHNLVSVIKANNVVPEVKIASSEFGGEGSYLALIYL